MKKILLYIVLSFTPLNAQEDFIVIALGESCGVTAALETFNLKKASYPFEWCISNFEPLYQSLKNDFFDFTNPEFFSLYFDKRSPINKYGIVFAHDFPIIENGTNEKGEIQYILDPNWREKLPTIQAKYQRRIDRFHAACNSGKKVYFVRHLEITEEKADRLSDLITTLYPSLDFTLLCVRLQPPHLGVWQVNKVKNYYVDTSAIDGDIGEWKRIFIDAGILNPESLRNMKTLQETYKNNLCGQCSYCKDYFHR